MSANMPPRSHSADAKLYRDHVYVFSKMLVNRLGRTPLRLEAKFDVADIDPKGLGQAIRQAIDRSLPWVEWEEFEKVYEPLGEPVSQALGIPNRNLYRVDKESGRVSVNDWPEDPNYDFSVWVMKRNSGKSIDKEYSPLPKSCTDEQLGLYVLECLRDSLAETLAANKK